MTQPAVSQYISKTEYAVGSILLDRQLRPARLTPAGEVFRNRAEALLASAESAISAVRNVGAQPLPELRVAVPNSIAATLTAYIYSFVEKQMKPGNFLLNVGQADDHVRSLLEREVDLVITSDVVETFGDIKRYPLFRESFVLMIPTDYDAEGKSLIEIADELPFIRFSNKNILGQLVERHLRRMRIQIPRVAEFGTAQSIAAMVAAGHGFAIGTSLCVMEGGAVGHDVVCAPFPGPAFSRTLHLLARGQELGERADVFAERCRQAVPDYIIPRLAPKIPWLNGGVQAIYPDDA